MTDSEHSEHRADWEDGAAVGQPADGRLAYRPAELAALVGLSTKAIYRAIERGELHAVKVANGSRLLVPASATEEWLEVNEVVPRRRTKPRKPSPADEAADPSVRLSLGSRTLLGRTRIVCR